MSADWIAVASAEHVVIGRRDMDWFDAREAPIRPLLDTLSFIGGKTTGATRCASAC